VQVTVSPASSGRRRLQIGGGVVLDVVIGFATVTDLQTAETVLEPRMASAAATTAIFAQVSVPITVAAQPTQLTSSGSYLSTTSSSTDSSLTMVVGIVGGAVVISLIIGICAIRMRYAARRTTTTVKTVAVTTISNPVADMTSTSSTAGGSVEMDEKI